MGLAGLPAQAPARGKTARAAECGEGTRNQNFLGGYFVSIQPVRPRQPDFRFRQHSNRVGLSGEDPELVSRGGDQARDDQLPHLQARARRPVLRQDLRPGDRLGVLVRQVQAHEAPRRDLRQMRRRSDPEPRAPRAAGPYRTGLALLARVVLQGSAEPHRPVARHQPARARARALLRGLHRGRGRRRSTG